MNIATIEELIKELNQQASPDNIWDNIDYAQDCVNYDTAAWLFDVHFNEPCATYYHNNDDFAGYKNGTPEKDAWENRNNDWEICGEGTFLNYPDHFVIRARYARPTYIQVLRWLENMYEAKIDITSTKISVENLHIPSGGGGKYFVDKFEYYTGSFPPCSPRFLAYLTVKLIVSRIRLLSHSLSIDFEKTNFKYV